MRDTDKSAESPTYILVDIIKYLVCFKDAKAILILTNVNQDIIGQRYYRANNKNKHIGANAYKKIEKNRVSRVPVFNYVFSCVIVAKQV